MHSDLLTGSTLRSRLTESHNTFAEYRLNVVCVDLMGSLNGLFESYRQVFVRAAAHSMCQCSMYVRLRVSVCVSVLFDICMCFFLRTSAYGFGPAYSGCFHC